MMALFSLIFSTGLGEKCMGFFHSFEKSWNNLLFFMGNLLFFMANLLFFMADLLFFMAELLFFMIENQDSALIYCQLTMTMLGCIVQSLGIGLLHTAIFDLLFRLCFSCIRHWQLMFFVQSHNEEILNCFSGIDIIIVMPSCFHPNCLSVSSTEVTPFTSILSFWWFVHSAHSFSSKCSATSLHTLKV